MWTKKSHFVYLYFHIRRFRLPLIMPLYIFWELIDAVEDMILLFGRFSGIDPAGVIGAIAETVYALTSLGRFDLVDVEAGHGKEKVKIKICLR